MQVLPVRNNFHVAMRSQDVESSVAEENLVNEEVVDDTAVVTEPLAEGSEVEVFEKSFFEEEEDKNDNLLKVSLGLATLGALTYGIVKHRKVAGLEEEINKLKDSPLKEEAEKVSKEVIEKLEKEAVSLKEKLAEFEKKLKTSDDSLLNVTKELQTAKNNLKTATGKLESKEKELASVGKELEAKQKELDSANDKIEELGKKDKTKKTCKERWNEFWQNLKSKMPKWGKKDSK